MDNFDGYIPPERPEWLQTLARRAIAAANDAEAEDRADRSPRVRTLIRAVIGGSDRPSEDVIVRNVSPGGMCIASRTMTPSAGEMIRVSLPGQADLQAQVRWVREGEFGVLLSDGLDVARLQATNRQRNAGFARALEQLLGIRSRDGTGSDGLHAC